MPQLLIAIAILVGGYWLIKKSAAMQPAQAKGFMRKMAGGGMVGLAGLLALRGATAIAVPLFVAGLGLIGLNSNFAGGFNWGAKKTGQKSKVATQILSMELDHDTGTMAGEVLKGPFKGRALVDLTQGELQSLYAYCAEISDQSSALLEAWLDRNKTDWRESWGKPGSSSASQARGAMTEEEALSVLGLKKGASADDIKAAHRRLMKDFHPDRGGSDYLAAKINQAKDVLLQD
jgi:DnaJ domain